MVKSVKFKEEQRLAQWWLWLILIPVALLPLYGLYQQFIIGEPFGNNPLSDTGLIIYAGLSFAFVGMFYFVKLILTVDEQGIHVHYFPILRREASWDQIRKCEMIKFGFIGGYGIRLTSRYGTVYNARGRMGLQIYLKNGKKFCVGTQRAEDLKSVIEKLHPDSKA